MTTINEFEPMIKKFPYIKHLKQDIFYRFGYYLKKDFPQDISPSFDENYFNDLPALYQYLLEYVSFYQSVTSDYDIPSEYGDFLYSLLERAFKEDKIYVANMIYMVLYYASSSFYRRGRDKSLNLIKECSFSSTQMIIALWIYTFMCEDYDHPLEIKNVKQLASENKNHGENIIEYIDYIWGHVDVARNYSPPYFEDMIYEFVERSDNYHTKAFDEDLSAIKAIFFPYRNDDRFWNYLRLDKENFNSYFLKKMDEFFDCECKKYREYDQDKHVASDKYLELNATKSPRDQLFRKCREFEIYLRIITIGGYMFLIPKDLHLMLIDYM